MKTGRLIMPNTRHICNAPITMEQYFWKQIKKETACLEDIFMDASSVTTAG